MDVIVIYNGYQDCVCHHCMQLILGLCVSSLYARDIVRIVRVNEFTHNENLTCGWAEAVPAAACPSSNLDQIQEDLRPYCS